MTRRCGSCRRCGRPSPTPRSPPAPPWSPTGSSPTSAAPGALWAGSPAWWSDTWVHDQVIHAARGLDDALDRWRQLFKAALTEYHEQGKLAINPRSGKRDKQQAERRRAEARNQLALLRNDDRGVRCHRLLLLPIPGQRGLPAWLLLPPAAAGRVHTRAARRRYDGDYLQRPRFVAISEFGPGSLIYHEGARYEVHRIQLPRDPNETTTGSGGTLTETAKRCAACGYHHPVAVGTDVCERLRRTPRRKPVRPDAAADRVHPPPRTHQQRRGGTPPLRLRARGVLPLRRPRRTTRLHPRPGRRPGRRRGAAAAGARPRRRRRRCGWRTSAAGAASTPPTGASGSTCARVAG